MKLPILTLHKIGPVRSKYWMTRDQLFSKIQLLVSLGYNFTTCEALSSGTYPKENPCILTFDDSYENFLTDAMPVLERFNIPATVFVPTGYIGKDNRGWENYDIVPVKHLTEGQIMYLDQAGIDFQPHTVNHINFLRLNSDQRRREAVESKDTIEQLLGKKKDVFCYPGGGYDQEAKDILLTAGYNMSVSCDKGVDDTDTMDRFAIKRLTSYSEII